MAAHRVSHARRQAFFMRDLFSSERRLWSSEFQARAAQYRQRIQRKNGDVLEQAKMVESTIAQANLLRDAAAGFQPASLRQFRNRRSRCLIPARRIRAGAEVPASSALDLLIERYARNADENVRNLIVTTLEHMAKGGVYDQLAGGFHRYSVDERWVVPHFEDVLRQLRVAEELCSCLSSHRLGILCQRSEGHYPLDGRMVDDRERGGFYASQDADISMDDDGDYFTWTLEETRAVLTEEEAQVAALHYDINEVGDMHHNPAKNVLYVRAPLDEIARRMNVSSGRVQELLDSARERCTPLVWAANALCRQDGICRMEQHVRFSLSGSG